MYTSASMARRTPLPRPMSEEEAAAEGCLLTAWYARDLPMCYEVLMENQTDPSHLPFAHHGVAGVSLPCFSGLFYAVKDSASE
jgi:phenylpropionate dioxygenase-like ring-hydroxylating dioxygenase large terminal subunit